MNLTSPSHARLALALVVSLPVLAATATASAISADPGAPATGPHTQDAQALTLTPTALETFAARPDVSITWSKLIGLFDGRGAYAVVSAVTLESDGTPRDRMRGIRIELRRDGERRGCDLMHLEWQVLCERPQAQVFIEEARLSQVRAAILSARGAEVHPGHPSGITYFRSSAGGQELNSGVLLFGFGISGRTLEEFAAMIEATEAALAKAPR
ncbi:MAG: hypothetical protein R2752_02350 [Vicinamibacterales bacterium]